MLTWTKGCSPLQQGLHVQAHKIPSEVAPDTEMKDENVAGRRILCTTWDGMGTLFIVSVSGGASQVNFNGDNGLLGASMTPRILESFIYHGRLWALSLTTQAEKRKMHT